MFTKLCNTNNEVRIISLLFITLLVLSSCGTVNPYYKSSRNFSAISRTQKEVSYSIFLTGDTGNPKFKKYEKVLSTLRYHLEKAGRNSAIIFLGDNIYPNGMSSNLGSLERKRDEAIVTHTLQVLKNYKGRSFFIPGNHDWNSGLEGIQAQEQFIESYRYADVQFLPNNGCPGPVGLTLGKKWFLIILDSEWWINRSYVSSFVPETCKQKSRDAVINKVAKLVEQHEDKHILLAFHHPLFSNGNHGGYYSIKDHIFPLTNLADFLYVPLPLIGSAYPIYRKLGRPEQDLSNNDYEWFKHQILQAVEDHEINFFASGHEHSLSFYKKDKKKRIKEGKNYFIVSGSGSKRSYARAGSVAEFVYSHKGFAKLVSYEDGSVAVEFWVPDEQSKKGRLVYRQTLIASETKKSTKGNTAASRKKESTGLQDSLITIAAGPQYKTGKIGQFFLGKHYRQAWTTQVKVPVLRINDGKGGWKILAKTGGMQTTTLITESPKGKMYVMRSVQKNPNRSLPPKLRKTFVADIAQDQTSASHPYGRVIVPTLAEAVGVYHTTPKLRYIPSLESISSKIGNKPGLLVTVEEFANKKWFNRTYERQALEIIDTDELWERMRAGKTGVIDQRQLVRSRLFDMYIGDWDRHARQWFWAKTTTDSTVAYQPIPIDRDNAFFKSDGLLLGLTKLFLLRKFQNFGEDIDDIEGINMNAEYFDRWFMNELPLNEWIEIARQMKQALTDSVIKAAVKQWPSHITKLNGEVFIKKLKARREKLVEFARRYYNVLAKSVNVFGSDKKEYFWIERKSNGNVFVRMYRIKSNSNQRQLMYSRLFKDEKTDEIRLYGFGSADRFEIKGDPDEALKIRIIGGTGYDTIYNRSNADETWVYDTKKGSKIISQKEVHNKTSDDPSVNRYEKRSFVYDSILPVIASGYNENDGVFIGGGILITKYEFRKKPFAVQHRITAKIATLTEAFSFDYQGTFTDRIGSFDLELGLEIQGPNYSSNFFGLGNETGKNGRDEDFFEYRYDHAEVKIGIAREFENLLTIRAGVGYEYFEPSFMKDRFVTTPAANLGSSAFRRHHYAMLYAGFSVKTTDRKILPKYGMEFNVLSELKLGLNKRSQTFNRLSSTISFYYTFPAITTTLASQIGAATNMGDYNFFQANTLGGQSLSQESGNLRGFQRDRFSGRTILYHNTELRTKLIDFESYFFPGSAGIFAFFDEGRVWADHKSSDLWHFGYGGGIWISPLHRAVITAGVAFSKEEQLFNVSIGFLF